MAYKYGLTLNDIENVNNKLEKQTTFLKNFILNLGDGDFNLLDNCMSANINPKKYFAEVNNRVNSLFKYANMMELKPVFLTITCPSEYHPSSKNYDPNISVKDSVRYLSEKWASFLRLKVFTHIKKAINHNMIFIRVIEPHKDGCPHCHVMIFIPKNYVHKVRITFKRHFTADGASTYAQNFRYTWHNESGGAVAYILKYINKTFKHALNDQMTLEAYYYANYSIRRFTTSQTLLPLYVHRKIKHEPKFRDFIYTTLKYRDGTIYPLFDKTIFFYRYYDEDGYQESILYSRSPILDQLFKKSSVHVPEKVHTFKKRSPAPVVINDQLSNYVFNHNKFYAVKKPYYKYSDHDLLVYFNSLDIDSCDLNHFCYIRNLLVSRGVIEDDYLVDQLYTASDYQRLFEFETN